MILTLNHEEADLVRYALIELSQKRSEQALDERINGQADEWAAANEKEARALRRLADRVSELKGGVA